MATKTSLFYLGIIRNESGPNKTVELIAEKNLNDYSRFTRGSVSEFMTMFAKTVSERTRPGQHQDVEEQAYTFHVYARSEGISGVIISDQAYDSRAAHALLNKMVDEFLSENPRSAWATGDHPNVAFPKLKEYIVQYEKPEEVDSLLKVRKVLDETEGILRKTMEDVLRRGEKLEDLVAKSDGLSSQSKMFYTQAKKQNSCCVLM